MTEYSYEDTQWFYLGVAINQMPKGELRRERILNGLSKFPQGIQVDGEWTVKTTDEDIKYLLKVGEVKTVNRVTKYAHMTITNKFLVANS